MSRILTGVQSTGTPHLGNLLGAIIPAIKMANDPKNESFLFIADMHSLTQIKNGEELRQNTYSTAATWLACGLDINKTVFYRQSDIPQVNQPNLDLLKEYTAEWEKLKARGLKLKNEAIPAFNKQLWDLGMGAIW